MAGHSDISMTNRYAHLFMAHKEPQQERLARDYSSHADHERPWFNTKWSFS